MKKIHRPGPTRIHLLLKRLLWSLSLLFICSAAVFTLAQENKPEAAGKPPDPEEPIRLFARNQEKHGDTVLARGDVELHFRDIVLLAEEIQVNTSTYEVIASGYVTLQQPAEIISCDRLIYNLKTREGRMDNVHSIARPNLMFGASLIKKNQENIYELHQAWLTGCTQPVPRWSFSVDRASLKIGDSIALKGAVFRIKKTPVLYLPYLKYPLKERATGFLFPRIGYSRVKGFSLSESFYWAIAPNLDLTLTGEFYSRQGGGGGLEFRYLFDHETSGLLSAYYFLFSRRTDLEGLPGSAYLLRWSHQQLLPGGFRLDGAIDYSSSFNFLREFENNFSYGTSGNRSRSLSLNRSWSMFSLNLRASRYETYFPQTGQSSVSSFLPQLHFNLFKFRVYRSLFLSWQSGYSNQVYSYTRTDSATISYKNSLAFFRPKLSLPLLPFPWLSLNLAAGGNLSYHLQNYSSGTNSGVDQPVFISQKTFEAQLQGPTLYRVFFRDNEPFLKHLVEPFIWYSYESPLSPDLLDRLVSPFGFTRKNEVKYGLTQHFVIRTENSPKEILTLGISQTFYFDPRTSEIRRYYPFQTDRHFSPVNFLFRLYPPGKFKLDLSADYNTYEKNFLNLRVSPVYGQPDDRFYFSLNWSKSYYLLGPDSIYRFNQAGLQAGFRWPEKLDIKLEMQRDLKAGKQLYSGLYAVYHYQCLDFVMEFRTYHYRIKPETQFRFSVRLGNIGQTADFLGAFGF